MAKANRYTLPDMYYACTVEDGGLMPGNATYDELPPKPWAHTWPQKKADKGWDMVEDHRERKEPYFSEDLEQEGTAYWLSEDTHDSQPRIMKEVGPLPEGAMLEKPEKLLAVAQGEKHREIDAGYESALVAALTMPSAAPTPMTVAMETSALLAVDADAVDSIKAVLEVRRTELHTQVDAITISAGMSNAAATTAVAAITVSYPI